MRSRLSSRARSLRPRRALLGLLALALMSTGCSDKGAQVRVNLTTDLIPGFEFHQVKIELFDDIPPLPTNPSATQGTHLLRSQTALMQQGEFIEDVRIADFLDVPIGTAYVVTRLFNDAGDEVIRQVTAGNITDQGLALKVTITRDCVGVECPAAGNASAIACLRGTCVDPLCPADRSACPDELEECAADADCAGFFSEETAACVSPSCAIGYCFATAMSGACEADKVCSPTAGCVLAESGSTPVDPECAYELCDPGMECRVGAVNCDTSACDVIGFALEGEPCEGGSCDADGVCQPSDAS